LIATEKGNLNAVGDAGVALFAAYAALRSGALNVYTNAKLITDKTFTEARLKELEKLLSGTEGAMGSRTSVLMPIKLRPV
jgi:methenyltetrahydrofolate cyclohydrolase